MQRVEQHLRTIRPNLMAFYDRFRGEGRTPAQAMQAAAYAAWMHADNSTVGPQARPHPGRVPSHQAVSGRVPDGFNEATATDSPRRADETWCWHHDDRTRRRTDAGTDGAVEPTPAPAAADDCDVYVGRHAPDRQVECFDNASTSIRAQLRHLVGSGHVTYAERPDDFAQAVTEFAAGRAERL
jgi:hypothetical protein